MSWFKNKVSKVIAITVIVLVFVFGALIAYKVVTHKESGLLEVCWVKNGEQMDVVRYNRGMEGSNGPCDRVEELVWPKVQIPLSVATVAYDGTSAYPSNAYQRKGVDSAIKSINSQVGFTLFNSVGDRSGADVVFKVEKAMDAGGSGKGRDRISKRLGHVAYTTHYRVNDNDRADVKRWRSVVVVYSGFGTLRRDFLVAHHELLHVAGLAHDEDNPDSAIYPFIIDDFILDKVGSIRITDNDRELLREKYMD